MPMHVRTRATPPSLLGRIIISAFLSIFVFAGIAMAFQMFPSIWEHLRSYSWTNATCVIETSTHGSDSSPDIQYSFLIDGRRHVGKVITPGVTRYDSVSEVEKLLNRYQKGASVPCTYNPAQPEKSFLVRRSMFYPLVLLFPGIFILVGGGIMWAVWSSKSDNADSPFEQKSLSRRKTSSGVGRWFIFLFFGAFALFGGAMTYVVLVGPAISVFQARSWNETDCNVISSEVRSHSGDSTTYSPLIVYQYRASGREFRSDRYTFVGGSSGGYADKQKVVDAYPAGHAFRCYVNPSDPTDAVIERGLVSQMWIGLIPLVFFLVGLSGLVFGSRLVETKTAAAKPTAGFGAGPQGSFDRNREFTVGSSRVDLQACKLEYSIVSPK